MTTIIVLASGTNISDGSTKEVQEDVADVAAKVNAAVSSNLDFVALTEKDGKAITIRASKVKDIREA